MEGSPIAGETPALQKQGKTPALQKQGKTARHQISI
jgi:hypothetical protein